MNIKLYNKALNNIYNKEFYNYRKSILTIFDNGMHEKELWYMIIDQIFPTLIILSPNQVVAQFMKMLVAM
jgi:hypothetical protein